MERLDGRLKIPVERIVQLSVRIALAPGHNYWCDTSCRNHDQVWHRPQGHKKGFFAVIRKILLATLLGSFALTATACNTVKGLGQDIESVGQAGDDAM